MISSFSCHALVFKYRSIYWVGYIIADLESHWSSACFIEDGIPGKESIRWKDETRHGKEEIGGEAENDPMIYECERSSS